MQVQEATTPKSFGIYHDLFINASLERVYKAVSDPQELINWWPNQCTGTPKVGEEYNFYFTHEYNWYGKVTKAIPNKSFHIKMTQSDTDWEPTSFGFDISEEQEQVKLEFWHTGWPACNNHYKRSSFCWAMLLNGLKNYIEHGVIIPIEERE